MHIHALQIFAWLALLVAALSSQSAAKGNDPPPADKHNERASAERSEPTSEQIAAWIAQLDDNRYLAREQATRRLLETQAAALDSLLVAANGERPEPADRAVWILQRIGGSKEPGLRRQALERLVQLQNRPQAAAAAREALAAIRHNEAVDAIQRLGGRYVTGEYPMQFVGAYMPPRVELDNQWRGGDAGLAHLRNLIGARTVIIIGTDISAQGAAELQHVSQLEDVLLYGTKIAQEEVPALQKLLPQVAIDYRRGGLLGVGPVSADVMAAAVVGTVQPGSAAALAGILTNDVILRLNGQPVPNFKALTTMIGKYGAGEEVTVDVLRAGQEIQFKVKLGEWKSVP
jgi:PDZ domain